MLAAQDVAEKVKTLGITALHIKLRATGGNRSKSLFIFRNFSSIGVIDKSGVQVERSSIFEVTGSIGNASTKNRSRSRNRDCSLCIQMSSTSRGNSMFVFRNLSSIRIINKISVQVE